MVQEARSLVEWERGREKGEVGEVVEIMGGVSEGSIGLVGARLSHFFDRNIGEQRREYY